MRRRLPLSALWAACTLVAAPHARAAETSPPGVAEARGGTLTDAELDRLRGGYFTAGGLTLDFGAVTRTVVDGRLALETQLTWSPDGVQVTQTGGAGASAAMTSSALAAAGIDLKGMGKAYLTPDGGSAVVQRATAQGLANLIVNTASNRTISQDTAVTLSLPGFQAVQGQLSTAALASRLATQVADVALMAATRH